MSWSDGVLKATRTDTNVVAKHHDIRDLRAEHLHDHHEPRRQRHHHALEPERCARLEPVVPHHARTRATRSQTWLWMAGRGAVASYTFSNVTAPHTIAATFEVNTYTLTYTAGTGGTITGHTPQTVRRRRTAPRSRPSPNPATPS